MNFERIDVKLIHPKFFELCTRLVEVCAQRGQTYFCTFGFRTPDEQNALYAQGRSNNKPRVTKAKAWESPHNFGLAMDFVADLEPNKKGLQPDWRHPSYDLLGVVCAELGLAWGGRFSDRPHVGIHGYESATQLAPLKKLWDKRKTQEENLKKIWESVLWKT